MNRRRCRSHSRTKPANRIAGLVIHSSNICPSYCAHTFAPTHTHEHYLSMHVAFEHVEGCWSSEFVTQCLRCCSITCTLYMYVNIRMRMCVSVVSTPQGVIYHCWSSAAVINRTDSTALTQWSRSMRYDNNAVVVLVGRRPTPPPPSLHMAVNLSTSFANVMSPLFYVT